MDSLVALKLNPKQFSVFCIVVIYLIQLILYTCVIQWVFFVLVTTTPEPTPRPRIEYQIATWSLVGASIITLIIIAALGITLWLRTRDL